MKSTKTMSKKKVLAKTVKILENQHDLKEITYPSHNFETVKCAICKMWFEDIWCLRGHHNQIHKDHPWSRQLLEINASLSKGPKLPLVPVPQEALDDSKTAELPPQVKDLLDSTETPQLLQGRLIADLLPGFSFYRQNFVNVEEF